jgi:diguanylate cyclase (GGDEF)-like protein
MMGAILKRSGTWLPTVLVLLVTLLAGARLVMLSLERHADDDRAAARAALIQARGSLEAQLRGLATRAARPDSQRLEPETRAIAAEVDGEWPRATASDTAGTMGIIRQGSQWMVVARAPGSASIAWSALEPLMSRAGIGHLVDSGYDFTFAEIDTSNGRSRSFVNSGPLRLDQPEQVTVPLPEGFTTVMAGTAFELAVQPSAGWYPANRVATEIGLLALLAWLVAFGTHDLLHRSQHLKQLLDESQVRQATLGERLETEIEGRMDLQKSFEHARYHDAFTGLPNRRFFMDQLDRSLREVRSRRRHGVAVAVIDIDRFSLITETLGHAAGDELMVQAAQRFEQAVRGVESTLARLEGSQFALLMFDVLDSKAALKLTRTLQDCLREPFELRRHRLAIAASVGVSVADSGLTRAEDLLREADIALAAAKRNEGDRMVAYSRALGGDAASLVSLEADLHLAIERNELRLVFQPIVDLRTGLTVGAEALLRWQHPVEGVLSPDKFLSIAEESGLIVPITRWVIARVGRIAGDWRRRLDPGVLFYVSVNISASSLRDPNLAEHVSNTLTRAQLPASTLKFEITEGGLIENVAGARHILQRLHDMGIELMLDDFGTGYSSLNHLELFPFDFVKIDRPFVSRPGAEDANRGITSAVVQIASSLGLKAIAELVETQPVAEALQQMGCQYGQGYLFGMPGESEEALQRIRSRQPVTVLPATKQPVPQDDSPTMILPPIPSH